MNRINKLPNFLEAGELATEITRRCDEEPAAQEMVTEIVAETIIFDRGRGFGDWLMSQEIPDENDNMRQTTTEAHKSGAKTSEKFETSCQDPETGRVVMPSICPFYTAMGENETAFNSISYLPRNSEGG